MKTFIAAALMGAASAEMMSTEFMLFIEYVAKYNKTYETVDEFNMRREQFIKTHAFIEETNIS